MKTKLIACFSAVLLAVIGCQTPPAHQPEPPIKPYEPLPDMCPMLHLQQSIPSRCCYVACKEPRFPGAAYQHCKDSVLSNYNCSTDQYIVIGFSNFHTCHCK